MMPLYESPSQLAKQRVAEAEKRVADQVIRIDELIRKNEPIEQAKGVLNVFESTLRLMKEDLEIAMARGL